jgi:hypothetical protein
MLTLNSGDTAVLPLPPFGKFSLHLINGVNEAMMDLTKVGNHLSIYGIIGDNIDVVYGATAGNDLSITFNGAGVLSVVAYTQLAMTTIKL